VRTLDGIVHQGQATLVRYADGDRSIGVDADPGIDGDRNWDSGRRLREMEADGVAGEVGLNDPPAGPFK